MARSIFLKTGCLVLGWHGVLYRRCVSKIHLTFSVLFQCWFIAVVSVISGCGLVSNVQGHRENTFAFLTTIRAQGGSGNQQVTSRLEGICGSSPAPAQGRATYIRLLRAAFSWDLNM